MELFKLLHFSACGLVFDAVGVLLIGFAFFFKTIKAIAKESGTYFSGNTYLVDSLLKSKIDGMSGTALLFFGFIFQALGYSGLENKCLVIGCYIFLLIFILIYFVKYRSSKVKEWNDFLCNGGANENP